MTYAVFYAERDDGTHVFTWWRTSHARRNLPDYPMAQVSVEGEDVLVPTWFVAKQTEWHDATRRLLTRVNSLRDFDAIRDSHAGKGR